MDCLSAIPGLQMRRFGMNKTRSRRIQAMHNTARMLQLHLTMTRMAKQAGLCTSYKDWRIPLTLYNGLKNT